MDIRFSFMVAALGTMLACAPQAQARDMFGGSGMYNSRSNTSSSFRGNTRGNSWNSNSRNSGWGRDSNTLNGLRGNNSGRDYYSSSSNKRSPYENILKPDKRYDPQKVQSQWENKWAKQGKMAENYGKSLQKQYDNMIKQNSRMIDGSRKSFSNYGF